jgi:Zn-finger nucleic acid-binding protein
MQEGGKTVSETKTCESCGKEINAIYRVCPLCAAQLGDGGEFLPPSCPRCQEALEIYTQHEEEYDLCPRCGGLWLDRVEFHHATRKGKIHREQTFREEYRRKGLQDPGGYIPCVRCGKMMNRKNFAKISGVMIDECGGHGVWLDSGEFEKIRHFIADGGLDKAQDKEIEKTRVELKTLASRVDQTAFTHKLLHFWNVKRWLFGG